MRMVHNAGPQATSGPRQVVMSNRKVIISEPALSTD